MFYEIIYTRCGKGIDIVNGGVSKGVIGFKTYACSAGLLRDKEVDIKYLASIVGMTAPSDPPAFSDDAYMYFVHNRIKGCLLNFHPVINDLGEKGGFSRRGGNYINQVFVGTMESYPYEVFGNDELWDAKKRGQAYYYETDPGDLPVREKLVNRVGAIGVDEISRFVIGQRQETVKRAIAFLITQYAIPLSERRYLVIKDVNTSNIELWIAAIESAFSPRMAAGIPFATRMSDFDTKNRYAINASGNYQSQIDLQDTNQKRLFRAMIVGVDARDDSGTKKAVMRPTSPFVVLDGEKGTIDVDVAIDHPFYQLVTSYNDDHARFCREFLQMFNLWEPGESVFQLYEAFKNWEVYEKGKQPERLLRTIRTISNFKIIKTPFSESVYNLIKKDLVLHIKQDVSSASEIIGWICKNAEVFGEFDPDTYILRLISNTYIETLFASPMDKVVSDLNHFVYQSNYGNYVFSQLFGEGCLGKNKKRIASFTPQEWLAFLDIILKAPKQTIGTNNAYASYMIMGIRALYKAGDYRRVEWLSVQFQEKMPQTAGMHLLAEAKRATDKQYRTYLVRIWAAIFAETVVSDDGFWKAYDCLEKNGLKQEISVVLERRVSADMSVREKERFLEKILKDPRLEEIDLTPVFFALDCGLSVSDKRSLTIATLIQENLSSSTSCINSAHICAMEVLDDLKSKDILKQLKPFLMQGFPSLEDETYCSNLIKRLADKKMPYKVFSVIVKNASKSRFYTERIVEGAFQYIGTRNDLIVDQLMKTVEEMFAANHPYANPLFSVVVEKCSQFKNFDKNMCLIYDTIDSDQTKEFYKYYVVRQAKALREQNRQPSLIERLFGKNNANKQNGKKDD